MRVLVVWAHPLADSFSAALFHRVCTALEAFPGSTWTLRLERAVRRLERDGPQP